MIPLKNQTHNIDSKWHYDIIILKVNVGDPIWGKCQDS